MKEEAGARLTPPSYTTIAIPRKSAKDLIELQKKGVVLVACVLNISPSTIFNVFRDNAHPIVIYLSPSNGVYLDDVILSLTSSPVWLCELFSATIYICDALSFPNSLVTSHCSDSEPHPNLNLYILPNAIILCYHLPGS